MPQALHCLLVLAAQFPECPTAARRIHDDASLYDHRRDIESQDIRFFRPDPSRCPAAMAPILNTPQNFEWLRAPLIRGAVRIWFAPVLIAVTSAIAIAQFLGPSIPQAGEDAGPRRIVLRRAVILRLAFAMSDRTFDIC